VYVEQCDEKSFATVIDDHFITKLSDGSVVELKSNGAQTNVTYANRREYVNLVQAARLSEHRSQIDAIRRGIGSVVPLQLLNLLNWPELEVLGSGNRTVDVDLLRRHTRYADSTSADAAFVQYFWDTLQEFDEANRRLFVRFAWAQERLPADDAEFNSLRIRLLIKPSSYPFPDRVLPRADTCFFNLELPAYSSPAVMRSKLLYAINTAVTMDADTQQRLE